MTQQGQWQLTGSAAEKYEQVVVPYGFETWARELVEDMTLRPGDSVLDVACGTGIVARYAAEKVGASGRVTGLDLNPGMLAVARSLQLSPGAAEVSWVECSAVEMELDGDSFDVVLCQQGFQFFPDKLAALREMHRVLRPGGRLAISVWHKPSPLNIALVNGVERHLGTEAGNQQRASRIVPSAREIESYTLEAGFRDVRVNLSEKVRHLPRPEEYVPLHLAAQPVASQVLELTDDARGALLNDIVAELQPYVEENELVFPDSTNIAMASK